MIPATSSNLLNIFHLGSKTFCKKMVKDIKTITPTASFYKTVTEFGRTTVMVYDSEKNRIGHVDARIENGFQVGSQYCVKKQLNA